VIARPKKSPAIGHFWQTAIGSHDMLLSWTILLPNTHAARLQSSQVRFNR